MEAQTTVSDQSPVPPMIGGPSVDMTEKPKTFVDDMIRFQADRQAKIPAKPPAEEHPAAEPPAVDAPPVATTDLVDRPIQGKDGIFYNGKQYAPEEIHNVLRERDELIAKNAAKPVEKAKPDEELETLMYTDPKRYNQIIRSQAAQDAINQIESKKTQEKVRADFYSKYSDLKGNEDLVEYHATKMQPTIANMPQEAALSKLAQAVRTRLSAISGKKEPTETLESKPAITAGATGNKSGSAPAPTGHESMTFIDQLKKVQRRGKTRY